MQNMSEAIAFCAVVYLISTAILVLAILSARHDSERAQTGDPLAKRRSKVEDRLSTKEPR
jgi:hypothetical protein